MKSWLLCNTTLEVWGVKYPRWHRDSPGICFSSLSVSHEGFCAKVCSSSYLPGFGAENSKQFHQSSPTWPGSRTQWHASVTDGTCRERERCPDWMQYTGLMRAIPQSTVYVPKTTVPWCKCSKCVLLLFLCLWVMVQRLQVKVRPITLTHISLNPPGTTDYLAVRCCATGCCLIGTTYFLPFFSF